MVKFNIFKVFKFNGVVDWFLIRFTSVLSLLSILSFLKFLFFTKKITYDLWIYYFSLVNVKILFLLFLFSIIIHSWIGIWQVITDYISNYLLNIFFQFILFFVCIFYLFYGINILFEV